MEEIGRRARLQVAYNGTDISADIESMIVDFSCTDNASGQADDLEITLEDRDGLWHSSWFPDKGAEIQARIECVNFLQPGERTTYPCGTYTVDEIDVDGPPWSMVLRTVSSTVHKSLRREEKTKAWEAMSFNEIAKEIAGSHNLSLIYEAPGISYQRKDQRKESDLAFLSRLAEEAGLKLKVAEKQIIVFDGQEFDAKGPSLTYSPQDLGSWKFSSQAHSVFRACRVDYWDAEQKQVLSYTFRPEAPPDVGQTLKINERVESLAAAEKKARAELRKKNEAEVTGTIYLAGDPRLFAGNTIELSGFGAFSGTYFIKKCQHTYNNQSGYTTSAQIRRTLDY